MVIDLSGPGAEPPPDLTVDDANDLRGFHFKRLMRKPLTWILTALVAIAAGIAAGDLPRRRCSAGDRRRRRRARACSSSSAIADSRAEEAFFDVYAEQRGLTLPAGPAAGGDAAAAQGRRPLRRDASSAAARRRASTARSPSTPTRRHHDSERQPRDQLLPLHGRPGRRPRVRRARPRALLPAQVRLPRAGEARGRLPQERAGQAGERGARRELRDLRRQGAGRQLAAPALLPHLHRLADRPGAGEVRLRAGRRHPLLLRQRPQEERRRARRDARRHRRGRQAPARRGARVADPRRHLQPR